MIPISLKKLLKKETAALMRDLLTVLDPNIEIQDENGAFLLGGAHKDFSRPKYPVEFEGATLGWVVGTEKAAAVAALLVHLAGREFEKKTLSQETLERYKEINLLYTLSAKLASCLDAQAVGRLVLDEARKLIKATSASVMLLNEQTHILNILTASGTAASSNLVLAPGHGVAGNVLLTGNGVVINDVQAAPEFIKGPTKISSLICVPLKIEEKIIGVMNISSDDIENYTAGDLKLANALAGQAAVSIENTRLQAERLENERIVQELDIARNIQQSLLPNTTPLIAGAEVAAVSLPAKQVGGDFYDFIPVADHKLGLVIADVSGKGVPAALFMALSRALMRANGLQDQRVAHAVVQTNRLILECATSGLFVTLFYAIVDTQTHALKYVSAGHNPPILYKKQTGAIQRLEADGIALGVMDDIVLEEKEATLEAGDLLVLYTDGVTEAVNMHEEEFGEDRLIQCIIENQTLAAGELIARITERVMAFAGEAPQYDDLTMMIVKIT